jgi:cobalt-zinc-cadmium efflux system membrane fusion protein
MSNVNPRVALLVALFVPGCTTPLPEAEELGIASVVVTQWNDSTELFLEYPHLVAGEQTGNWAIHLTDRTDFKPIYSGTLVVRFTGDAAGDPDEFVLEAPARDGIFLLDPVIPRAGTYTVALELSSSQATSRHVLPQVQVHASMAEAPLDLGEDDGAGEIAFLKEQQWVIPFGVAPAAERDVQSSARAPAEIVAPDGALFQVSAPVDGIAPVDANRDSPSVGERVREGQVLVVLAPTTQEGGFAEVRGRVEGLQREVERSERLVGVGAVAQRRLDEARHNLDIAQAELQAMGGVTGGDFLLRLRAPMDGVIARRDFVPGGRVGAGVPLFTVVDPSTAWLRVQLPVTQTAALATGSARFTVEGSSEVHETSGLLSVGSVVDPRTRTVPVVYEVTGSAGRFSFGQLANVFVPLSGVERGLAIPDAAVLDENGTPIAYVQLGGETFERRVLTLGPSDGTWVLVEAGIEREEMVVAAGAYQVRLASLSGNEFAGAHAH